MASRSVPSHLKVKAAGTHALQVRLEGNPQKPEPDTFLVNFPGGFVEITRTTDNDYWVHVSSNKEEFAEYGSDGKRIDGRPIGKMIDGRINFEREDTESPSVLHMAARITTDLSKQSTGEVL